MEANLIMTIKVIRSSHSYLMSSLDQFSVIFTYRFYHVYSIYKTLKISISKKTRKGKEDVEGDKVHDVHM